MPTLAELDHAMSRPGRYVPAVRQLGGGTVTARGEGQPFRIVGSHAAVYRLENREFGEIALRCFLDDEVSLQTVELYRRLSQPVNHRRLLAPEDSPLVERIAYFADGVELRGKDLRSFSAPLVATEWLKGPTLFRAADHACRSSNREALGSLADGWSRAIAALEAVQFVHGSLSPDNALVDLNRGIVLVDYDRSWWPGLPIHEIDDGLEHYRHRRAAQTNPDRRDRFPALLIYVSLRVLTEDPRLRLRYGQPATVLDGSLLFGSHDLQSPSKSVLFRETSGIRDVETRALAGILYEAARGDPGQTPTIAEAAEAAATAKRLVVAPSGWAPAPSAESPGIESLPGDRAALKEPPVSAPPVDDELRERLDEAIDAGDVMTVADLWPRFSGEAGMSHRALEANRLIQRFARAGLDEALNSESAEHIVDAVTASRAMGAPVSMRGVRADRQSRLEIDLRRRLQEATASDDREQLADLAVIEDALPLSVHDDDLRSTLSLAFDWRMLQEAITGDDDQRILRAVTPQLWTTRGYLDQTALDRIQLARARMRWKEDIRRTLKERDDRQLIELMERRPADAELKLTPIERQRIDRRIAQVRAVQRLERAMSSDSDRELVDAMNEVESTGALLPPELDWGGIRDMIDRLSLVASIRRAATSEPRDYLRLGRLLPALREAFGNQQPYLGSSLDVAELEWEVRRDTHRRRLLEAIATGDQTAIAHAASPDPYGVVPTLPDEQRAMIEQLLAHIGQQNPLLPNDSLSGP